MSGETWRKFGKLSIRERAHIKRVLRYRDGDNCHYCREPLVFSGFLRHDPEFATIEHLTSRGLGGTNEINNLVLAHQRCNHEKNDAWQRAGRPGRRPLHDH